MKLLRINFILVMGIVAMFMACSSGKGNLYKNKSRIGMEKSKQEWKSVLTDEQYYVMIEKGTERPYTGEYWNVFKDGVYKCAACGASLFDSDTKFDAHCGWPSFYDVIENDRIATAEDYKLGYKRIEIMCANCGAHLGHVFPDGPEPTGLRYCVNSVSIKLDTIKK